MPPGCEVTYELEAIDILKSLLRRSDTQTQDEALQRYYEDFRTVHGVRPTAVEAYQDGYNPRSVRERAGSWTQFVGTMGDLTADQQRALDVHKGFITSLDTTEMVKSYKMLVLLAMIDADRFPGSIAIDDLARQVERLATRTARAAADIGASLSDRRALIRLLEQNPIAAWAGGKGTGGVSYFLEPVRKQREQCLFSYRLLWPVQRRRMSPLFIHWALRERDIQDDVRRGG